MLPSRADDQVRDRGVDAVRTALRRPTPIAEAGAPLGVSCHGMLGSATGCASVTAAVECHPCSGKKVLPMFPVCTALGLTNAETDADSIETIAAAPQLSRDLFAAFCEAAPRVKCQNALAV
jgi:hypothetical protein